MYSFRLRARGCSGFGPLRLAFELQPLAVGEVESSCPSGCSAREVGYQPVGMKPERLGVRRGRRR